jgi:hypothetical protein
MTEDTAAKIAQLVPLGDEAGIEIPVGLAAAAAVEAVELRLEDMLVDFKSVEGQGTGDSVDLAALFDAQADPVQGQPVAADIFPAGSSVLDTALVVMVPGIMGDASLGADDLVQAVMPTP